MTRPGAGRERALFAGLLLLHLAPIWIFAGLPTQDGPSHLANAWILLRLASGGCPVDAEFYTVNATLFPNWLAPLALAGLGLALPPGAAERVLQSAFVVGFALAGRAALRRVGPGGAHLSAGLFPLAFSYPFLMGFYAFSLGLALALSIFAAWLARAERAGVSDAAWLAAAFVAAFFLHPFALGLGAALVLTAALSLARDDILEAREPGRPGALWDALRDRLAAPLLAVLPAAALTTIWLAGPPGPGATWWLPASSRVAKLLAGDALVGYGTAEYAFAAPTALAFVALGAAALASRSRHPLRAGLAGLWLLVLLAYALAPEAGARGSFVGDRLLLAFLLLALLLGATRELRPRRAALIQGLLVALGLGLLATKVYALREIAPVRAEYLSVGDAIAPGSIVLPLNHEAGSRLRGGGPSLRVDPLFHAAGHFAARRCVVVLDNYEAGYREHFPTRFFARRNPYAHADYDDEIPDRASPARYLERTGRAIDYVLLWGAEAAAARADPERRARIARQLAEIEADYELAASSPGAKGRLYRRRRDPAGGS
jgi:hypothetical protein